MSRRAQELMGPALAENLLCRVHEKRTIRVTKVKIGIPGKR
jgi:hypothetical protein